MNTLLRISAIGFLLISTPSMASGVTIPNTFTAGTPAQAGQVNANFTAVKNAVDDNDARLDALEPSATPVAVDCGSDANALQTAINANVRTGKLLINFTGTCNPVFIARSNVEIVGASRAAAKIVGATGAWNSSVTIKNANYVKLKTLTIMRSDDQFLIGAAWRSNVTLDDVLIDHAGGGSEGFGFIQSTGSVNNSDMKNLAVHVGSSVILEDDNNIIRTDPAGSALEITEGSTLLVLGSNNVMTSTGDVLDMSENSSFSVNSGTTGNALSGDMYFTDSTARFEAGLALTSGTMNLNSGSSASWENDTPASVTANIQAHTNSIINMQDVNLTGSLTLRQGAIANIRNSTVSGAVTIDRQTMINADGSSFTGGGSLSDDSLLQVTNGGGVSGNWVLYSYPGPYLMYLDSGVSWAGATFNCGAGHGNVVSQAWIGLSDNTACGDPDSDTFINYLDNCPSTPGATNGCP